MDYEMHAAPEYLWATMIERETVAETRAFMRAIARANEGYHRTAVLIDVRRSRTIFSSEPDGLLAGLKKIARTPTFRIALLGDTAELRLSHEYLALLARQQGLNVWSFPFEAAAVQWLANRRRRRERRGLAERRGRTAQRADTAQRRRLARRFASRKEHGGLSTTA